MYLKYVCGRVLIDHCFNLGRIHKNSFQNYMAKEETRSNQKEHLLSLTNKWFWWSAYCTWDRWTAYFSGLLEYTRISSMNMMTHWSSACQKILFIRSMKEAWELVNPNNIILNLYRPYRHRKTVFKIFFLLSIGSTPIWGRYWRRPRLLITNRKDRWYEVEDISVLLLPGWVLCSLCIIWGSHHSSSQIAPERPKRND